MRFLYIFIICGSFLVLENTVFAQKPNKGDFDIASAITTPNSNYIKQTTYIELGTLRGRTDISYYDGLGNLSQVINVGASLNKRNIVTPLYYDKMGHGDARVYFPYVATSYFSEMEATPFKDQEAYYNNLYGADGKFAYVQKVYEKSPFNRVLSQNNAGAEFQGANAKTFDYQLNEDDNVICISVNTEDAYFDFDRYYPDYTLYKNSVISEDGVESHVFIDKSGHTVLSRVGSADTYYGYDEFGRLAIVIPPAGTAALPEGASVRLLDDDEIIRENCYLYNYNDHGYMTRKHFPGHELDQYMIYDNMGRVINQSDDRRSRMGSSQNAEFITRIYDYDSFGRLKTQNNIRLHFDPAFGLQKNDIIVAKYIYDEYPELPAYLCFKTVDSGGGQYDGRVKGQKVYEKLVILDDKTWTDPQYIERAFYYDEKVRLLQIVEKNHMQEIVILNNVYDFIGNVLKKYEMHYAYSDQGVTQLKCQKCIDYTYDHRDRILSETTTIDGTSVTMNYEYDNLGKLIAKSSGGIVNSYKYNIQGWMTEYRTTSGNTDIFRSELRYFNPEHSGVKRLYSGNISEWKWQHKDQPQNTYALSYDSYDRFSSARRYSGDDSMPQNSFTEQGITYDKNGNLLSLVRYGGSNTTPDESLNYTYQGNRLTSVDGTSSGSYEYDWNGNMILDGRKNLKIKYNFLNLPEQVLNTGSNEIVSYTYLADGTKLGAFDKNGEGYVYSGSLVYKRNENQTYSLESTDFAGGRMVVSSPIFKPGVDIKPGEVESVVTPPFVGDVSAARLSDFDVELSDVPTFITRIFTPYYHLTDHLGSVRAIVNKEGIVQERNDYYTFGLRWKNPDVLVSDNRYLYNGKEDQGMFGFKWLDYGARMYDPELGRWHSEDPFLEKYYSLSSYAYCAGNPVNYVDADGRVILVPLLLKVGGRLLENNASGSTARELGYAMQHPINAVRVGPYSEVFNKSMPRSLIPISTIAGNFQVNFERATKTDRGEGSYSNALRHTIWQGIITSKMGADHAERIGNAHEANPNVDLTQREFGKITEADQVVDLLNNQIGRELAIENPGLSNQEFALKVLDEFYNNGLWVATQSGDKWRIDRERLSILVYERALEELQAAANQGLRK